MYVNFFVKGIIITMSFFKGNVFTFPRLTLYFIAISMSLNKGKFFFSFTHKSPDL